MEQEGSYATNLHSYQTVTRVQSFNFKSGCLLTDSSETETWQTNRTHRIQKVLFNVYITISSKLESQPYSSSVIHYMLGPEFPRQLLRSASPKIYWFLATYNESSSQRLSVPAANNLRKPQNQSQQMCTLLFPKSLPSDILLLFSESEPLGLASDPKISLLVSCKAEMEQYQWALGSLGKDWSRILASGSGIPILNASEARKGQSSHDWNWIQSEVISTRSSDSVVLVM